MSDEITAYGHTARKLGKFSYLYMREPIQITVFPNLGNPSQWCFETLLGRLETIGMLPSTKGVAPTPTDAFTLAIESLAPYRDALNLLCRDVMS